MLNGKLQLVRLPDDRREVLHFNTVVVMIPRAPLKVYQKFSSMMNPKTDATILPAPPKKVRNSALIFNASRLSGAVVS